MKARFYSCIVMVAILIILVFFSPIEFGILFMAITSVLMVKEFLSVSKNKVIKKVKFIICGFSFIIPLLMYYKPEVIDLYYVFIIMGIMLIYLKNHDDLDYKDTCFLVCGATILPIAFNMITGIYLLDFGKYLILIPMIAAWCSDVFAYLVGRTFGKHKLAPTISPNKTIEGSIGGILGGVVGMLIFAYFTKQFIDMSIIITIAIGALGSIVGQMGDLCFSMIKRQTGIKDYSKLIPGHGGILDRFDSIMFTAPITYILLTLI